MKELKEEFIKNHKKIQSNKDSLMRKLLIQRNTKILKDLGRSQLRLLGKKEN